MFLHLIFFKGEDLGEGLFGSWILVGVEVGGGFGVRDGRDLGSVVLQKGAMILQTHRIDRKIVFLTLIDVINK